MLPIYEIRKSDLSVKRNNYELNFPEHMHEYIEIVYACRGVQHLKIENREYELREGNLAVIFPDTLHSYFSLDKKEPDGQEREILILICSPKLFGSLFPNLKSLTSETSVISAEHINPRLKTALECINPDDSFEVRFSWACVIISYVTEMLELKKREAQPVNDMVYKIVKYVEENFSEPLTRSLIAKKFNVSEGYISKIFTQKFRMNFRSYLGIIRAEYAASLIRTTNESFTVISQLSGFDSQRTFNRMFKVAYGVAPKEYKNNINKFMKED